MIQTTLSKFATKLLTLKGKPFSFEGYLPFKEVYDIQSRGVVIKAGRQVGKSVSLAGRIVAESVLRPYFHTLYLTPLSAQAARFSTVYLDPYLSQGLIQKHFQNNATIRNVYEKSLSTGSRIYLSYGSDETELGRVRGISSDIVLVDEVQDIDLDALPVVLEVLSSSEHKMERYAGTSKTVNNSLEILWRRSSMNEWATKCGSCGTYNVPDTLENCLAMCRYEHGVSCIHCGKPLDVTTGVWAVANKDSRLAGFHLPQHIFGSRVSSKNWMDLHGKVNSGRYTESKIANEVFGLAYSSGGTPITVADALACCNPDKRAFDSCRPSDTRSIIFCVMGVDWSVSSSTTSYTVITIAGFDLNHKAYILFSERLQGTEILSQVARVEELYQKYNVNRIFSDRGVGVLQGELLARSLGNDVITMIQYVSSKVDGRYEKMGNFIAIDRTKAIGEAIYYIKQGRKYFETPAFEVSEPYWADALNLVDEETSAGKIVYRHPNGCDDWLHSVVFLLVGYKYSFDAGISLDAPRGLSDGIHDQEWDNAGMWY